MRFTIMIIPITTTIMRMSMTHTRMITPAAQTAATIIMTIIIMIISIMIKMTMVI